MIETRNRLSSYSKYAILKDCSSIKEKDNLIQKILSNNSEFSEKEEQVNSAFGDWLKLQEKKYNSTIPTGKKYLHIANLIKQIDCEQISVGIVDTKNKYEFWLICETKDYSVLDSVYDIYQEHCDLLPKPIDFILVGKQQFIGKDNIPFLTII